MQFKSTVRIQKELYLLFLQKWNVLSETVKIAKNVNFMVCGFDPIKLQYKKLCLNNK